MELLEREAVSFLVKYINEVSIRDFFEIFGHGVNLLMRKAMRINHLWKNLRGTYHKSFGVWGKGKPVQELIKRQCLIDLIVSQSTGIYCQSGRRCSKTSATCDSICIVVTNDSHVYITQIFRCISKLRNGIYLSTFKIELNETIYMQVSERESLGFISGFILFSLKKSIKSKLSPESFVLHRLHLYDGVKEEKVAFLEFIKLWNSCTNCGVLLLVCDELYVFVTEIENKVQEVLAINFLIAYCGTNVKKVIKEKLSAHQKIWKLWDTLTKNMSNKLHTEKLKLQEMN